MAGRRRTPTRAQLEVVDDFAPDVEIRLSARRERTIAGRMERGRVIVLAPMSMDAVHLRKSTSDLVERVRRKHSVAAGQESDEDLLLRAAELNDKYLEGRAEFTGVRWVTNMTRRWASCSVDSGRIRISDRLKEVPGYVLDSVVIHELVHTWIPDHGADFHLWASRAPQSERAAGYLEAYSRWGVGDDGSPADID
ncbi:MAG: M48 metallopeptidase family protein [Mycobacteriaceae bacterium]|uniref:M48 metallopeptidase family protein n=1 Tax=Corynebacterium sp. TaxID=1720 RepID=UPI003F94832E